MAAVVSDTSPIFALAHLGRLDVLHALFGRILFPPAVEAELLDPPEGLSPVTVRELGFVEVRGPDDATRVQSLREGLDPGESEAIALALEVGASVILIDEEDGRAEAARWAWSRSGPSACSSSAKQRGLIDAVGPLVDRLRDEINYFISESLRIRVLRLSGEVAEGDEP